MSVAGISSTNLFDFNSQTVQNRKQQFQQEFQQLGQDLQSGNLSAAQTDFTTLQQSGPQITSSSTNQNTSPIAQDFKQLSQDIQSGNVSAAQQDYAKIQQDFQRQSAGKHAHHHHQGGGSGEGSAISQLMQELGQDLQTGNLTSAQQAYGTLQQDFQQFAQTNGVFDSSTPSNSSGVSVNA
jgi:outer membrane protein assembly factor BamD (BamD/ComL family)